MSDGHEPTGPRERTRGPSHDGSYPDMDAIRAAHQPPPFDPRAALSEEAAALTRFNESMELDYDRWKEGTGYDLDALRAMSPVARAIVELRLTPPTGWRDVEALAHIDTPTAAETLRAAAEHGTPEVRMAVLHHAPQLVPQDARTISLVQALSEARPFEGLSATLDQVMDHHPPPVVDALFAQLLAAPGENAYHYAAALTVIHGKAESEYDWALRPLWLEFNTDDVTARRAAFLALCSAIGVDGPARLAAIRITTPPTGDDS